jgi:hypothetical protein
MTKPIDPLTLSPREIAKLAETMLSELEDTLGECFHCSVRPDGRNESLFRWLTTARDEITRVLAMLDSVERNPEPPIGVRVAQEFVESMALYPHLHGSVVRELRALADRVERRGVDDRLPSSE